MKTKKTIIELNVITKKDIQAARALLKCLKKINQIRKKELTEIKRLNSKVKPGK